MDTIGGLSGKDCYLLMNAVPCLLAILAATRKFNNVLPFQLALFLCRRYNDAFC